MTDLFSEKSKDWDTKDVTKGLSAAIGTAIVAQVPLNQDMRVMDFGAGTGLISSQVAPHVNKILAVDISQAMLDKLVSKPELDNKVEALCQDIIATPLADKFDLIMSAMAMHHVKDTSKLIQRFAENLSAGGWIALADLDQEDGSFHTNGTEGVFHSGFERSELQALLEQQGFKQIKFITAHTVQKENNEYPIFLVTAIKTE